MTHTQNSPQVTNIATAEVPLAGFLENRRAVLGRDWLVRFQLVFRCDDIGHGDEDPVILRDVDTDVTLTVADGPPLFVSKCFLYGFVNLPDNPLNLSARSWFDVRGARPV